MFKSSVGAALVAVFLMVPNAAALLEKPAMRSNLDILKSGLQANLPSHSYTYATFNDGYIATGCKDRALADGYSPYDYNTYVVTYNDCSVEWLMCRHKNSQTSLPAFLENFGRVPVRMRQAVKEIVMGPARSGIGAYAYGDQLVMFNVADNVAVYLHEVTHAVDWSQHFPVSGRLPDSSLWLNAYNADSAVPDEYARNAQVENVAQFPSLAITDAYVPGGMKALDSNVGRVSRQLQVMVSQGAGGKYGALFQRDNVQCSNRKANSGWEQLPPRKRATGAERREAASSGPLPGRPNFPSTAEEQKAYIESKGVKFVEVPAFRMAEAIQQTNCTAFH